MAKRSMYIWKLKPVLDAEGGVAELVDRAVRAKLSAIWIKIADGATGYQNVNGQMRSKFESVVEQCQGKGIQVWGWHVPHCATEAQAVLESSIVRQLARDLKIDGIIMDAEGGGTFFQGGKREAKAYAEAMRASANELGKSLAISSNDIPQNIEGWLPRFNKIAPLVDLNYPQVYYGSSPSVQHRLDRAESANRHVTAPFAPVGAAWIGEGGGCSSASACAERAREFIRLVHERGFPEYSFWHWGGAPSSFWAVLNSTPA